VYQKKESKNVSSDKVSGRGLVGDVDPGGRPLEALTWIKRVIETTKKRKGLDSSRGEAGGRERGQQTWKSDEPETSPNLEAGNQSQQRVSKTSPIRPDRNSKKQPPRRRKRGSQ